MEIERAREDLVVAGSAAGTTVILVLLTRIELFASIGTFAMLAPLVVYFAYVFSRKGGPYGTWDTAQNWAIAALGVGIGVALLTIV